MCRIKSFVSVVFAQMRGFSPMATEMAVIGGWSSPKAFFPDLAAANGKAMLLISLASWNLIGRFFLLKRWIVPGAG